MLSSILPKKNEKIRLYCYDTSGQIHSFFGRIRHQKHISKLTDLYLFDVQFVLQSFYYNCILNLHTSFFSNVFIGAFFFKKYFENEQFITVHPAFWRLPDCPSWKFQAGQDDGWSLFDLSNANVYYLSTISSSFLPKWGEIIFEVVILFVKVARWKKHLCIILNIQQKFDFSFPVTPCLPF